MSAYDRLEVHARLMDRMADRNGADLDLALQSGRITPEKLRAAILSCTACTNPEDCEHRLETGEEGVPDYCRNADLIKRVAGKNGLG